MDLKGELEIVRLAEKNHPARKPKERGHFVSTLLVQNTHGLRREEWSLLSSPRTCHRSAMPRKASPLLYMPAWLLEVVCLSRYIADLCPHIRVGVLG